MMDKQAALKLLSPQLIGDRKEKEVEL